MRTVLAQKVFLQMAGAKEFHALGAKACLQELNSSEDGLSESEAQERRAQYGLNELKEKKGKSPVLVFLEQFSSILVLLLIAGFPAIMCAGPISMLFSAFNPNFLRVTEKIVCRETGQAVIQTYHTRPGSTSFEMYCIDVEGQRSKDDVIILAIGVLFLAYFVIFSAGIGGHDFWRGVKGKRAVPDGTLPSPRRRMAGALVDSHVRDLLARGNKLEAIKIVRQATGMGLAEAKNYVETLERTQIIRINNTSSAPMDTAPEIRLADIVGGVRPELKNKLLALIEMDQKAVAIQIVRDELGVSLELANDYVEMLASRVSVDDSETAPEEQLAKMRELKKMLDEGLITQQEYEAKKKEILSQF